MSMKLVETRVIHIKMTTCHFRLQFLNFTSKLVKNVWNIMDKLYMLNDYTCYVLYTVLVTFSLIVKCRIVSNWMYDVTHYVDL